MVTAADDLPLLDLLWTFVLFFSLMIYFWLLITVFADLFRRHELSGWAKTGWIAFVFVLPLIGSLTYLVSQGREMSERMADRDARRGRFGPEVTVPSQRSRPVEDISRAKELLDRGAISQEEFEQLKRRALV